MRGLIYPSSTGKPPYQRVRLETAERILAVPVEDSSRAANSHVDATGTRRRLQALIAVGWAQAWLARELHRSPANFRRSMTADTVTARTAQLVNEMYDRLWDAPPPQHTGSQRNASHAARAHAALQGWLPPLAWDDIDNDPDPDPNQPHTSSDDDDLDEIAIERAIAGDTRVHLTYAEQIEVVRRMSERVALSGPSPTCCPPASAPSRATADRAAQHERPEADRHTCYTLACSDCGDDPWDEFTPHFPTEEALWAAVLGENGYGWTRRP